MKKSVLQFSTPYITYLNITRNNNFDKDSVVKINTDFNVDIKKDINDNFALIKLMGTIGDNMAPFTIECNIEAMFKWEIVSDNSDNVNIDELLQYNAPALLLSYMRPIISNITSQAGFPPYDIPFMDFRKINNSK